MSNNSGDNYFNPFDTNSEQIGSNQVVTSSAGDESVVVNEGFTEAADNISIVSATKSLDKIQIVGKDGIEVSLSSISDTTAKFTISAPIFAVGQTTLGNGLTVSSGQSDKLAYYVSPSNIATAEKLIYNPTVGSLDYDISNVITTNVSDKINITTADDSKGIDFTFSSGNPAQVYAHLGALTLKTDGAKIVLNQTSEISFLNSNLNKFQNGIKIENPSSSNQTNSKNTGLEIAAPAGSIPLVVGANALVVDIDISSNSKVGIGTNAPTHSLHVVGDISGTVYHGDGSNLTGVTTSPAGSNTQIQFNDSNSFGASSDFTWDNTNKKLDIAGSFVITGSSTAQVFGVSATATPEPHINLFTVASGEIGFSSELDQAVHLKFNKDSLTSSRIGNIQWHPTDGGVPRFQFSDDLLMYGSSKLRFYSHANSPELYGSTGSLYLNTNGSTASHEGLQISGSSAQTLFSIRSPSDSNIFKVDGTGIIGVGAAPQSGYRLNVGGDIRVVNSRVLAEEFVWYSNSSEGYIKWNDGQLFNGLTRISASVNARVEITGSDDSTLLGVHSTTNANILTVSGSGYVGIGTNDPENLLHIYAGNSGLTANRTGTQLLLESDDHQHITLRAPGSKEQAIYFVNSSVNDNAGMVYQASPARLMLRAANENVLSIKDSKVGILTTTPTAAFHVAGPAGKVTIGGSNAGSAQLYLSSEGTGERIQAYKSGGGEAFAILADGTIKSSGRNIISGSAARLEVTGSDDSALLGVHSATTSNIFYVTGSGRVSINPSQVSSNPNAALNVRSLTNSNVIHFSRSDVSSITGQLRITADMSLNINSADFVFTHNYGENVRFYQSGRTRLSSSLGTSTFEVTGADDSVLFGIHSATNSDILSVSGSGYVKVKDRLYFADYGNEYITQNGDNHLGIYASNGSIDLVAPRIDIGNGGSPDVHLNFAATNSGTLKWIQADSRFEMEDTLFVKSDFVGIGTNNPQALLHLEGNASGNNPSYPHILLSDTTPADNREVKIECTAGDYVVKQGNNLTTSSPTIDGKYSITDGGYHTAWGSSFQVRTMAGSERFKVESTGAEIYVNIGTPTNFADFDSYQLVVKGGSGTGNTSGVLLTTTETSGGGSAIIHHDTDSWGKGNLSLYTKRANTATAPIETMRLGADGITRIFGPGGEHTSAGPTDLDDVVLYLDNKKVTGNGTHASILEINTNGSNGSSTRYSIDGSFRATVGSTGTGDLRLATRANFNKDIIFSPNSVETARFATGGNATIGSATTNAHTINGSLQSTGDYPINTFATTSGAFRLRSSGLNDLFYVKDDGKVGINNSSPSHWLDVKDSGGQRRFYVSGDVYVAGSTDLRFDTDNRQINWTGGSGRINSHTSHFLYLQESSKCGVGIAHTVDPSAILHVSGSSTDVIFRASSDASQHLFNITGQARVGIGIASPSEALDVDGNMRLDGVIKSTKFADLNNVGYYLQPSNSAISAKLNGAVIIGGTTPAAQLDVQGDMLIKKPAASHILQIQNTNNTTTASALKTLTGQHSPSADSNIFVFKSGDDSATLGGIYYKHGTGVTFGTTSDQRLKNNIRETTVDSLEKIKALKLYDFEWDLNGYEIECGFVAQNVEEHIPEAVFDNADDMKSISTENIIPHLTKAIQQQQEIIESLISRIEELEN